MRIKRNIVWKSGERCSATGAPSWGISDCSCSHAFILNSRYETNPKTERTYEGTVI